MEACREILTSSLIQKKPSLLSNKNSPFQLIQFTQNPRIRRGFSTKTAVTATLTTERIARAVAKIAEEKSVEFKVRASVTIKRKVKEGLKERIATELDAVGDKIGRGIVLELVSTEIDARSKKAKTSKKSILKDWHDKKDLKSDRVVYTADFVVDTKFGEPGAITIVNHHQKEFFVENIVVEGFNSGPVHFTCNSWVQPKKIHSKKRVFFTNKPYVPSETPPGLRQLRDEELKELRGDGTGERKMTDRIYDFALYNDLGSPDKGHEFARPVLGGDKLPYPRRLRTGRSPTDTDLTAESRSEAPGPMYVPRDEAFEEAKNKMLSAGAMKALLHNIVPSLVASISPETRDFSAFHDVDNLFKEGIRLKQGLSDHVLKKVPLVSRIQESEGILKYDTPQIISKDKFAWLRDDEFARQVLAGINPVSIERMQSFPPMSKLDPEIYGNPESAIKEEHIIGQLNGMSVQQAIDENKLYILDYHDIYIPFIDRINAQDGRKAYGTRTIFFLTPVGTLKPVAIELSLPPASPSDTRANRVMTPPANASDNWLWQMAKAHVCSNDAGVHQLVNHWLRTHACVEPFIIAAHREMSVMHPIFKLLKPHMRYTLEINALARQILISGGGVIESGFTPGSCCMEMSAAYYKDHWRFDQEGLPAELIRRGMAVPDPTQPHGLRLLLPDYPYAADGLLLWSAISSFVTAYVTHTYPTPSHIHSDSELNSWYQETIRSGHPDKPHGWPPLSTPADLISILTTLIWLSSAQHAALNFGQYPLGGYIPSRPPLMRRLLPHPSDPDHKFFLDDPHKFFLMSLPSLTQATTFMTVIDTLSTHSEDEEYIGDARGNAWTGDEEMVEAFEAFSKEVEWVEEEIRRRNEDVGLRNRCGAGVLPYELMKPKSKPGITCMGVPNSISI